jgi:hypothetical protein
MLVLKNSDRIKLSSTIPRCFSLERPLEAPSLSATTSLMYVKRRLFREILVIIFGIKRFWVLVTTFALAGLFPSPFPLPLFPSPK